MGNLYNSIDIELAELQAKGNRRDLPQLHPEGRFIMSGGRKMVNLSSNDYLGLAVDKELRNEFFRDLEPDDFAMSASSSRLLTGNTPEYDALEELLAKLYGAEDALMLGSGYHANEGILPVVADRRSLILADKLVHASIIDGIRLSSAKCVRYRHNDLKQLERLLDEHHRSYERIFIVTESIFSMDGDEADLQALVALKYKYNNVYLYVDEAHAVGLRGAYGLGCAEEKNLINDIDFLVGTLGKALASVGAFLICSRKIKDILTNRMRPFIYTTALPPINIKWTIFVLNHLAGFMQRRTYLDAISKKVRDSLHEAKIATSSSSQIIPVIVGDSACALCWAEAMQRKGFYVLPVRPPTVPEGTSRLRISLTASMTEEEVARLIQCIYGLWNKNF